MMDLNESSKNLLDKLKISDTNEKSTELSQWQIKNSIFNCRMILNNDNDDIIIHFNENKFIQKLCIVINEINIRSSEVIFIFFLFKIKFFFLCFCFGTSNSGLKISNNINNLMKQDFNINKLEEIEDRIQLYI